MIRRQLVLLRRVHRQRHVIHRSRRIHHFRQVRLHEPAREKPARKPDVERRRRAEARLVFRQYIMQVRRPRPRMSQHEHRVVSHFRPTPPRAQRAVRDRRQRVRERHARQKHQPRRERHRIDRPSVRPERPRPPDERDAGHRVVFHVPVRAAHAALDHRRRRHAARCAAVGRRRHRRANTKNSEPIGRNARARTRERANATRSAQT